MWRRCGEPPTLRTIRAEPSTPTGRYSNFSRFGTAQVTELMEQLSDPDFVQLLQSNPEIIRQATRRIDDN
jgi:hypothetical protein